MSRPSLTRRDRRALLAGALVLAPFFLFQYAVRPYVAALFGVREQVRIERDLLARELALLDEGGTYPEQRAAVELALERHRPRLFSGPDQISATGALVSYLGADARTHRVLLQRSETRAPLASEHGLVLLSVSLRGLSDLHGLLSYLHALENGEKLVRVEELAVTGSGSASLGGRGGEEVLQFTATVMGFAALDSLPNDRRASRQATEESG